MSHSIDAKESEAQKPATREELRQIPDITKAIRQKFDLSDRRQRRPSSARKRTISPRTQIHRGDPLFDLALVLARAEDDMAQEAIKLSAGARVAEAMVELLEPALEAGSAGLADRAAILALSVLANLACIGAHTQLLAPTVDAVDIFVAVLQSPRLVASHPLALPYAVAGVRNLANHSKAASQLRADGGEALLEGLVASGYHGVPLDEALAVHCKAALGHIAALAPPGDKDTGETPAERGARLQREARAERQAIVARARAVRTLQQYARRWLLTRRLLASLKQSTVDELRGATSTTLQQLVADVLSLDAEQRLRAARELAVFSAGCSIPRLDELAAHLDAILRAAFAPGTDTLVRAAGACVIANAAYTRAGQAAALKAGAVEQLLDALGGKTQLEGPLKHVAMAQCAAALQNLSHDSRQVCDHLVSKKCTRLLQRLMAQDYETLKEYAAGIMINMRMFATGGVAYLPAEDQEMLSAMGGRRKSSLAGMAKAVRTGSGDGPSASQATTPGAHDGVPSTPIATPAKLAAPGTGSSGGGLSFGVLSPTNSVAPSAFGDTPNARSGRRRVVQASAIPETPADRRARAILRRKQARESMVRHRAIVRIQACWRGLKARQLADLERQTSRGRLPASVRKIQGRAAPPPDPPAVDGKAKRAHTRVAVKPRSKSKAKGQAGAAAGAAEEGGAAGSTSRALSPGATSTAPGGGPVDPAAELLDAILSGEDPSAAGRSRAGSPVRAVRTASPSGRAKSPVDGQPPTRYFGTMYKSPSASKGASLKASKTASRRGSGEGAGTDSAGLPLPLPRALDLPGSSPDTADGGAASRAGARRPSIGAVPMPALSPREAP